jgi:endo-alpha-N-acetylgalactosaminidase
MMKRRNYNRLYISLAAIVLLPMAGAVVYDQHDAVRAADTVTAQAEEVAYQSDLSKIANWQSVNVKGGFTAKYVDNALNLQRSGTANSVVIMDIASPSLADGEAQYTFTYSAADANTGRVGISFRNTDSGQWAFVGYNTSGNWVVEADKNYSGSGSAWQDLNIGKALEAGKSYTMKIQYVGKHLTVWLNGDQIIDGDYALLPTSAGRVGTRLWYDSKTLSISNFAANSIGAKPADPTKIVQVTPVNLQTKINEAPVMPKTVQGLQVDGKRVDVPVTWDEIDPDSYAKAGSFTVSGKAADLPVMATVLVTTPIPTFEGPTIESSTLKVTLSDKYPEARQYQLKDTGKTFGGTQDELTTVKIDGTDYTPAITYEKKSDTEGVYHVNVADKVSFDVLATVKDKTFKFKVDNIKEVGSFKLHTLEFPGQNMISVYSSEDGTEFAGTRMYTATSASQNGATGDTFRKLGVQKDGITEHYMYGFLNNQDTAAAIWTNAAQDGASKSENNRITYTTKKTDSGINTGLSTGAFALRAAEDNTTALSDTMIPAPEVAVSFGKDENNDKKVDWQDAAIAFRQVMNEPKGWQDTKRVVAQRIPMNFASQATNPFLDTLDETKRVYNITDGLGQTVLLKGYQNEGHDSAHPDYGAIGQRQGGTADMNTLINEGHNYNASFGVHINDTETYPEAKSFSEQLADPTKPRWDWLDPSYAIRQRNDAISGNRYNRFQELKAETPNLDYIYVDVWGNQGEAGWESRRLAAEINNLDWVVHNEFPSSLEYDSLWNHWSAEKAYGGSSTKGFNSNIVRFIRNNEKDTWVISDNSLLGGAEFEAYEGWVGKTDFASFVEKTYQTDLPTKFLQHFEITNWNAKWDDAKKDYIGNIKLDHDVTVDNSSGTKTIDVNGTTVLQDTLSYGSSIGHSVSYLLPWDSSDKVGNGVKQGTADTDGLNYDKLYYWSDDGKSQTWQLLDKFKGASALHVYQLTDQGRVDKGTVPVSGGKVTLDLSAKTAYVLTPEAEKTESVVFGEGNHLKDPGFNAKGTLSSNWKIDSGEPAVIKTDMGDYIMQAGAPKMAVSQPITGLKKGNWSVYVNTETHDRPVTITVTAGGKTFTKTFKDSTAQNFIQADVNHTAGYQEKNLSYMQKARVDFTMPTDDANATLTISADAGKADDHTYFDDVRVVARNTDLTVNKDGKSVDKDGNKVVIYQNFEDTQAIGLYPFEKGSAGGVEDPRVHLSERHDKYTQYGWNGNKIDDVLEGNWSLKAHKQGDGLIYQTIPQTVYFEPGKQYQVEFDYQTDGDQQYVAGFVDGEYNPKTDNIDDPKFTWSELLGATNGDQSDADKAANHTKHFSATVTGAKDGKLGFLIYKIEGSTDFILDNFLVTEVKSETKQELTADNVTIKTGDAMPKESDFNIVALDKDGKPVAVKVDLSKVKTNTVGKYPVVITTDDGQTLTVMVNVVARDGGGTVTPPVTPEDGTKFETIKDKVISVQTGKAHQYVYDKASDSFKVTDKAPSLGLATEWRTAKKAVTKDGVTYYQVSADGYLRGEDVTMAKMKKQNGVVIVTNDEGAIARNDTTADATKVQTLKKGTAWQYSAVATNPDGTKVYLVADKQWVSENDIRVQGTQVVDSNYPVYIQTTKAQLYSYNEDTGQFKALGKDRGLKLATGWKATKKATTADGAVYYRVATNEWLRGLDATQSVTTAAQGVVQVTKSGGAAIYADPEAKPSKRTLANGSQWQYHAVSRSADGSVAYLVADREWLQAKDIRDNGKIFKVGAKSAPLVNGQGKGLNKTLKPNSAWKVTGTRFIDNMLYYRVATNEFVRADYGRYQ